MLVSYRGTRMRRLLTSRLFVAGTIVVALGGLLWMLGAMSAAQQTRAEDAARSAGQLVVSVLVRPHLDELASTTATANGADPAGIRAEVDQLRRDGKLIGLGVWRLDGTAVFTDPGSGSGALVLSAADLDRARVGASWASPAAGPDAHTQLRVFVPLRDGSAAGGGPGLIAQALVPQQAISPVVRDRLLAAQVAVGLLFLLLAAGVLGLRWRLLRRERDARHDPLTGLLNRRGLQEDAGTLLALSRTSKSVALLLIDLTEFKSVNDTLGHPVGDLLLQQVATTLKSRMRRADVVARLGGDEFAVMLTDVPDVAAAQDRADYLLALLRAESFIVQGIELSVDAAIGVAVAPDHGQGIDELLQRADIAMYQAKRAHRGSMAYNPTTDEHSIDQLAMIAELRHAIDNEEFVLHYQPKISLPNQQITGVEALVRWQHPLRGLVPPGEFLPVLEAAGLMAPLTRWVLRAAVHQAASWRRAGMPLKVAVNISPRSLLDYDLPARVLATLLAADLPPSLLELEITETAVMTNPERAAYILAQLQARGISVSMDDFGAGYTSLAFLRVLPLTALKIDRSLVADMLEGTKEEAVAQAVIDLAHRMGFEVVAEGVETEPLLHRLTDLGCDQAQGYLISRPLPAPALEGWMTGRHVARPSVVERMPASLAADG